MAGLAIRHRPAVAKSRVPGDTRGSAASVSRAMPAPNDRRGAGYDDEWDDEESGDDAWDDGDPDGDGSDDDPTTITCPSCGREIFDDTPRCPACGHFILDEERRSGGRPWWITVTAVVCLAVALWWILR